MTTMMIMTLVAFFAYATYLAVQVMRCETAAGAYLDGGGNLPAWVYLFTTAGLAIAAVAPYDQLRLLSLYGFQAAGLALALVLAALASALFQKRLVLAARILGQRTLGELLGAYYESTSIRIYLLLLLALFSLALPATFLAEAGDLLWTVSTGTVPRSFAIGGLGLFLFLFSAIGGWRAVIYVCAGLSFLVVVLLIFLTGLTASVFGTLAVLVQGFHTGGGILGDSIPGVIQFTRGIGLESPAGGIWTSVAVGSTALALAAVTFSPGYVFLGLTTRMKAELAFSQVWMVGALAAGLLLLFGPALAAELPALTGGTNPFAGLAARLSTVDDLGGVVVVLLLVSSLFIAISFFAASGASILTVELINRFVLPELTGSEQRLAARISLALIYAVVILAATLAPLTSAVIASLCFSLTAQLFMALLGLCWIPWLSRRAVITGLIMGLLIVFFTEPPGLILFSGLFIELPWGRWPLTIHSAAWGLFFNIGLTLLVAIWTRKGDERAHREPLHALLRTYDLQNLGGPGARAARWSLTLLWVFFALGPGAVLGNNFFSQPILSGSNIVLGAPSLWVWQTIFWILGVMLIWWLASWSRLGIIDDNALSAPTISAPHKRPPGWIDLFLRRVASSEDHGRRG